VQVTGYVLIVTNAIHSLGLNSLRIIRGETVFPSAGEADVPTWYSLYISLNYHIYHLPAIGLLELQLTSLRGVQKYHIAKTTKMLYGRASAFIRQSSFVIFERRCLTKGACTAGCKRCLVTPERHQTLPAAERHRPLASNQIMFIIGNRARISISKSVSKKISSRRP